MNEKTRLPIAGLDISDRSVKYLAFNPRDRNTLAGYGEIVLPEGMIISGEIQEEDALASILTKWIQGEGNMFRSYFFSVSLPEEKSFLRLIQLPKVRTEEVQNAIQWELEANIPLPQEELIYDYEVIESSQTNLNHFDIVLTAFPKTLVESYTRVLKKSGIRLWALELESQAIVRASVAYARGRTGTILVEIGYSRASFIVFAGSTIFFTTTVELGGKVFEENIASNLKVSPEKAAALKKEVGLNKREQEGRVFMALVPAIAVLADEIHRSIEYYQSHTAHIHGAAQDVQEILLAGGDANLFGLDTYLSVVLKIPVTRVDPFAAIGITNSTLPLIPIKKSLAFVSSLGLALRDMR